MQTNWLTTNGISVILSSKMVNFLKNVTPLTLKIDTRHNYVAYSEHAAFVMFPIGNSILNVNSVLNSAMV